MYDHRVICEQSKNLNLFLDLAALKTELPNISWNIALVLDVLVLVSLVCKSFQSVLILSKVVLIPNIKDLFIFHTRLFGQERFQNEIRIGIKNFSN